VFANDDVANCNGKHGRVVIIPSAHLVSLISAIYEATGFRATVVERKVILSCWHYNFKLIRSIASKL
jgi:hypothetical protein